MPADTTPYPKTALDAATDQALALARDTRAQMTDPGGVYLRSLAGSLAGFLREQFPDTPGLGRVAVSLAQHVASMSDAMTAGSAGAQFAGDLPSLMAVVVLAGEQLNRESPS
jgi:hypothetical protein